MSYDMNFRLTKFLKLRKSSKVQKYPMSTLKNDKKIAFDKLSSQERQAIYNASPFFKKNNEEAAAFLKKHPIPKEFIKQ